MPLDMFSTNWYRTKVKFKAGWNVIKHAIGIK